MNVHKWIGVAVAGILLLPMAASAVTYSGALSYTPPQDATDTVTVFAGGATWPNYNVTFSYQVTNEDGAFPGFPWRYTYTFTVANPSGTTEGGISHIIVETSPSFTLANLAGLSGAGFEDEGEEVKLQTVGSGNPQMPVDVYGIRFAPLADELTSMTWTFYSDREPIWGDFFVKNGGGDSKANVAWNSGFTSPDTDPPGGHPLFSGDPDFSTGPFFSADHVLVPDTGTTDQPPPNGAVPEPVTVLGVLFGLGGLAGYLRRRVL